MGEVWKHEVDPKILEKIFADPKAEPDPFGERRKELEEKLKVEKIEQEEIQEENIKKKARLKKFFERLPAREKDMLMMRYLEGKTQPQIAEFFEITQAAVHYRLQRALDRIKIYNRMIDIDEDEMKKDLSLLFDDLTVDIMMTIFETSTQSETARILGKSQFCIRSRFYDALKILSEGVTQTRWKEDFKKRVSSYVEIFQLIRQNWHILKEKLHKWKKADKIV